MTALKKSAIGLFIFIASVHDQNPSGQCIRTNANFPNEYIKFFLYTNETRDAPFELLPDTLRDAKFADTDDLKILVHGLPELRGSEFNELLRNAYFSQREYNIITVDYTPLVPSLECYDEAVENVPIVAICLSHLFDAVMAKHGPFKHVHAIGYCLGAQVIGIAGPLLKEKGQKFDRATGLDPALYGFGVLLNRLTVDSATTVDVLHTSSGLFGELLPIGTVDFYANGGIFQPGSGDSNSPTLWALDSHRRAYEYYAESIIYKPEKNIGFYANRESSLDKLSLFGGIGSVPPKGVLFGEYLDPKITGVYGFVTNDKPPYVPDEEGDNSVQ